MNHANVRSARPAALARFALLAATALAIGSGAACYQRVTSAKGIGSEEYTIYKKSDDNTILSDPKAPVRKNPTRPN